MRSTWLTSLYLSICPWGSNTCKGGRTQDTQVRCQGLRQDLLPHLLRSPNDQVTKVGEKIPEPKIRVTRWSGQRCWRFQRHLSQNLWHPLSLPRKLLSAPRGALQGPPALADGALLARGNSSAGGINKPPAPPAQPWR